MKHRSPSRYLALGAAPATVEGVLLYANRPHVEAEAATLNHDDIAVRGLTAVVEDHVERHSGGLFFVKNRDWASECEYRWVLRSPDPRPAFVSIAGTLAGIVVGQSFPPPDADMLRHYAEDFGITESLGRCYWRNGYPIVLPYSEAAPPRL